MLARYLKDIDLFADMETKLVVAQFWLEPLFRLQPLSVMKFVMA